MDDSLSRRQFVQKGAAASLAAVWTAHARAEDRPRVPLVDAHQHCFAGRSDPRFPYHERAPYRPEAPVTPEFLLQCMDAAGVDYGIIVHPEPYQDDHRYLEHCLEVGRGRLKGTLLLFADREGSLDKLPDLRRRLDVVALRVHAYAPDRLPPFGRPELRRLWQLAGEHGLAVQAHFEPRYAPGFEPLIREFKATRVIIDHMGRPFYGSPAEHAVVVRWSRFENTVMKLSAIPSADVYPHRDIQPVIRELTDAWGADRMIYGSDLGSRTTGESYAASFARARSHLEHLSEADRAKILGGTAVRLFGFRS